MGRYVTECNDALQLVAYALNPLSRLNSDSFGYDIMVYVMSIILILIAGYLVFRLLFHPIESIKFLFKLAVIALLGLTVWFGVFYACVEYAR